MLDYVDYTIGDSGYQGNGNGHDGNGYDKLVGDYAVFYKVAKGFTHRVKREDREDILHDLILAMARVKATYDAKGKELTEGGLVRIAQYGVADYWRKWYHRNQNHDCGRCSQRQRERCNEDNSYGSKCPKAIQLESLDTLVEDGDGDSTPLYELIADDSAVDVVAMLNARHILKGYPHKAVKLAYKRYAGYPLDVKERDYLSRFRKRLQKTLF